MNRRGFMGALAASGLIPFLPKPDKLLTDAVYSDDTITGGFLVSPEFSDELEGVRAGYLDTRRLHPDGTMTTTGNGSYTGERAGITYTVYDLPDGGRLRVPRLEGARALYHR